MPEIGETIRGLKIGRARSKAWYIWAACEDCGKERWTELRWGQLQYKRCHLCSVKTSGELNPHWKGGRYKTGNGYIRIKLQTNDFFYPMEDKGGYVLEHRLVVAKRLGRCLQPWELVHHKDGIRDHNEFSNLKLTTAGSHLLEHSKGYRDGYRQGYQDSQSKAIEELKAQNDGLLKQIKLLQWHQLDARYPTMKK